MRINGETRVKLPTGIQLVHLAGTVLFLALFLFAQWDNFPARDLTYPSCCLVLALIVWMPLSWKMSGGDLFSPYIIFATASVLFNAGRIILEVFGANPEGLVASPMRDNIIICSIYLLGLAHGALHWGALRGLNGPSKAGFHFAGRTAHLDRACILVGASLLIVSFLPALQLTRTLISSVSADGYVEGFLERPHGHGINATADRIAYFFPAACFFLIAGSRDHRLLRWLAILALVAQSLAYFYEGTRQLGAMTIVASLWIYHRSIGRLRYSILAITGVFFVVVVIPAVKSFRVGETGKEQRDPSMVKDALTSENPAVNALSEMGWTFTVLAEVYKRVPSERPYDCGLSYLFATSTIVPGLSAFLLPAYGVQSPDRWFALHFYIPRSGVMSYGFSYIAEAYLNFGILGLLVVPATIGFGLARAGLAVDYYGDPRLIALVGSMIGEGLVYARSDTFSVIQSLVWYSLCPWILTVVTARSIKQLKTIKGVTHAVSLRVLR